MAHPSQDVDRRAEVSESQSPFAVIFGCSDSRAAAEIIFDRGLGDLFVVRTAGHVVDTTVVGSIEYGVGVLGAPLVLVLGHDSCGAVAATAAAFTTGVMPSGFVRAIVDRVIPSIIGMQGEATRDGRALIVEHDQLGREHVRHTVEMLLAYSSLLRDAVQSGRCAVIGAEYTLAAGLAHKIVVMGDIGQDAPLRDVTVG